MNVGGGGGAVFIGGKGSAEAAVIVVPLLIVGLGIYGIASAIDAPKASPIAEAITAHSIENCINAESDPALYEDTLQDLLLSHWSSQLQEIQDKEDFTICVDPDLNGFTMPYKFNDATGGTHTGENRVVGVLYAGAYGGQTLVVKPPTDIIPETSTDLEPDRPMKINAVFEAVQEMPADTYQTRLSSGSTISVLVQFDGAILEEGRTTPKNNDGHEWADAEVLDQIQEHYNFAEPSW